jgi:hypothetical protein
MSKTIERIEQEIGIPGLVELLVNRLAPTDLQSLLLEVYRQQAQRRQPAALLSDYETNRFARPSTVSPISLLEWERTAFAQLPAEFQAIALSPVSPLGTCSAIALVDQNKVLSTIRNTEVVSDSTNVLALECALRRRQILANSPKSVESIHLATSHRLLRTQRYEGPNLASHFSIFSLCSAGRDQGNYHFELSVLALHIGFYLRSLRTYLGSGVSLRVALTDLQTDQPLLSTRLLSLLQTEFPGVECTLDDQRTSGRDYYAVLCFHVYAATPSGQMLELADGGAVNWTQKLLSNAKERCVISGIGSQRVCTEFAR